MLGTTEQPLLQEVSFNINRFVKVKLTEKGRTIYILRHLQDHVPGTESRRRLAAITDSDGYSKFQLYVLIALFGAHMPAHATIDRGELPFDTEIILLPDPIEVALAEREASDKLLYDS